MPADQTATRPTPATPGPMADDLRVLISQALTDLSSTLELVHELADTHQRGLGFMTAESKLIQDEQIRTDRHARWFNQVNGWYTGSGVTKTPGALSPLSLEAEVYFVLADLVRVVVRDATKAGVCPIQRITGDPGVPQMVTHLRNLSWHITNPRMLTGIHRQLEYLVAEGDRIVEGDDKTRLDGACPHCGRLSLVVFFRTGVIRCDRDPDTDQFEPCSCPDPLCDCKTNPHYRHQWFRDLGTAPNGWWKLADRLNLIRNQ